MFLLKGTKVASQLASRSSPCLQATLTCVPRVPCALPIAAELDGGRREAAPGERARAGAEKGLERCSGQEPEEGVLRHAQVCSWQRG